VDSHYTLVPLTK